MANGFLSYRPESHLRSGAALSVKITPVTPLLEDASAPFWERPWVTPDLHEALYCDDADDDAMRFYALVDPVVRTAVLGVDDLDSCDLPNTSLFEGEASDTLVDVAPRLIDITCGKSALKDRAPATFLASLIGMYWGTASGIFLASRLPLEELKNHLRHFTRVQNANGQWFYFRFWEPAALAHYLCGQRDTHDAVLPWFQSVAGNEPVSRILMEIEGGTAVLGLRPTPDDAKPRKQMQIKLSEKGWGLLEDHTEIQFYRRVSQTISDRKLTDASPEEVDGLIRYNLGKHHNFNLVAPRDIEALNCSAAKFGKDFHLNPPFAEIFASHGENPAVLGKYMRLWAA